VYDGTGLIKLRELVRSEHEVDVYLRQVTPDTYRRVLKEIKAREIYNLVVDTRPENMQHFLRGVGKNNISSIALQKLRQTK
jgi:ionotropic kainate glutamate receptor 2